MVNKTNKNFYRNLSRKELQRLCKKYGLPANRSHSYLAKSLASLSKKDIKSLSSRKSFSGFKEPFLPACTLQLPPQKLLNLAVMSKKDGTRGLIYRSGQKESNGAFCNARNCSEEKLRDMDGHNGLIDNVKETSRRKSSHIKSDSIPLFGSRPTENGTCLSENGSNGPLKTYVKAPSSFEFHVSSEAGINLYVDLNASPLDWTKRFHNEVFICENIHKNKCHILSKDLGFPMKNNKEMINSFLQIRSCLSSELVGDDHVGQSQPDKIEGTLMLSTMTSCSSTLDPSEPKKEYQTLVSTECRSGAHNSNISGSKSGAKTDKSAQILALDSNDISPGKHNSVIAISSYPSIPATLKHQNSTENPSLQNTSSLVNLFVECPGIFENRDDSWSLCETIDFEHDRERQESRINNSRDPNDTSKCHLPPSVEEQEKSNISVIEVSECVSLSNSMEKTCLGYEKPESEKESKKKRKRVEDVPQNHYHKSHTRILRSTKHIAKEVSPRRSGRLISK